VSEAIAAGRFVDLENGIIRREIFFNEDIYKRELEQIFARAWLFVGHESQVPNPGDFVLSKMGEESVILTRDSGGGLHVLLNTCRHRGMMVCRYDQGNTKTFYCPFHGWAYSTDGNLVDTPGALLGVPRYDTAYHGKLDKSQWGLVRARMHNYKGSVWATWDESAPAFLDYMGDMTLWLDELFDYRDGRPAGAEVLCGIQKWRIPCNWKFIAENFIGDMYHNTSHVSVERAKIGPSGSGGDRHGFKADYFDDRRLLSFPALGHGARGSLSDQDMPLPQYDDPLVDEYFKEVWEKRRKHFAGRQFVGGNGGAVFPNMVFHCGNPRTIGMAHPLGPMQTEMWRWYLVDRDAPQPVKDTLRRHFLRYSGPGGMTEQDDMENWNLAAAASKGVIAQRYPFNYQQGIGFVEPAKGVRGGVVTEGLINEENIRTFYRRWAELMDLEQWPAAAPQEKRGNGGG
jgi:phenylpropionate dioxygenase-like ring-hydroxylating dioxygenase large terminal subunit